MQTTRSSFQIPQSSSGSSLVPSNLAALADPPARYVDGPAMDYFVFEAVNTLRASATVALARTKKLEAEMIEAGLLPPPPPPPQSLKNKEPNPRDSVTSLKSASGKAQPPLDDEEEALRARLEAIGMHVGANFTERLCRDRPLFTETLDAIKFICKDIWAAFWDKQVDNLRTNHRGVYVLQDNQFKPIIRISSYEGRADALRRAKIYTAMPAGIIRGALSRMGYNATVTPEITSLPQCTFQIKLPKGS
ncbi:TRAPP complex subunit trs33 [Schizophyllum commune]